MANFDDISFTRMTYTEGSAPATPSTGNWVVYAKTDGLYYKDDAGVETGPLAAGGGSTYKTLLQTLTFSASASQTSSTFATTYDDLQIEFELWSSTGGSSLEVHSSNSICRSSEVVANVDDVCEADAENVSVCKSVL